MKHALILLLLVTCQKLAGCDYVLSVAVHAYRNQHHRTAAYWCCDPFCAACDNYFVFCLGRDCELGELHTGEVGGDDLTFDPGRGPESTIGSQPNPLTFVNRGIWPGSTHLLVDVYDDDDIFPTTLNGDEFVDTVLVLLTLPVSDDYTDPATYRGYYRRSEIVLSFRVTCVEDYYGRDCGTYCRGQDSQLGHYTCSEMGDRICMDGYRNASSNCTECIPASGCSPVRGFCQRPFECTCRDGYTGSHCETVLDACGSLNPCQNGGSCSNDGRGGYTCSCPPRYTGPTCLTAIGLCASEPCLNGGECEEEIDQYVCVCPEGYAGAKCEEEEEDTQEEGEKDVEDGEEEEDGDEENPEEEMEEEVGMEDSEQTSGDIRDAIGPDSGPVGSSGGSGGNRAAVIGGTVAAVLAVVLFAALVTIVILLLCRRWRRRRQRNFEGSLTEKLVDDTEHLANPGENPTYHPSAIGVHVRPAPSVSIASASTLYEVTNPLLEEGGVKEEGGGGGQHAARDRGGSGVSADLSITLQNPIYTTDTGLTGDVPRVVTPAGTNGSAPQIYSTYATLGDKHSDHAYDTVDHRSRPTLALAPPSPSSSMAGSGSYAYVRTPGAVRVLADVHNTQSAVEPRYYSTAYHNMPETDDS